MHETEEMRAAQQREINAWHYEVQMIQLAARSGDKLRYSQYHPDHYRRQIDRMQRLLKEAGV
jgi:predicted metallo-beta-lactamase superfamily hydrolase